jgi:hypothetical protein
MSQSGGSYLRTLVARAVGSEPAHVHSPARLQRRARALDRAEAVGLEGQITLENLGTHSPRSPSTGGGPAGMDPDDAPPEPTEPAATPGTPTTANRASGAPPTDARAEVGARGGTATGVTMMAAPQAPADTDAGGRADPPASPLATGAELRATAARGPLLPEAAEARSSTRAASDPTVTRAVPPERGAVTRRRDPATATAPSAGPRLSAREATPDVHIHIGRIELTAVTPPAAAPARPPGTAVPRAMSLDEYLHRRRGGRPT